MTIQDFLDKGAVLEVYSDKESYYAELLSVGESFEDREVWTHANVGLGVFGASFQDAIERLVLILNPLRPEDNRSKVEQLLDAIAALPYAERMTVMQQIKDAVNK